MMSTLLFLLIFAADCVSHWDTASNNIYMACCSVLSWKEQQVYEIA